MLLKTSRWIPARPELWSPALSRLLRDVEDAGCEVDLSSRSCTLFFPGPDRLLLAADGSLAKEFQRWFWDRAELAIDREQGELRCRWSYGSAAQLVLHAAASLPFVLYASADPARALAGLVFANLAMPAISLRESQRLREHLARAGFVRAP